MSTNTTPPSRKAYPTDVSDEEWALVAPYLTLVAEDTLQRRYVLREVCNAMRWIVRSGAPWRLLPTNFQPWPTVYQQTRRWLAAGCFEALVHDLRLLVRLGAGRNEQPSAVVFDARVVQSTSESGGRAGYSGHKRRTGPKTHAAVDMLGLLLALVGAGGSGAGRDGRPCRAGGGRSGLHRPGGRRHSRRSGYPAGGRQTAGRQARLRAAAAPLGGRT